MAPAKLVQYLKGRLSRRLQDEFGDLRKRYGGQHLWARGYFCASVGADNNRAHRALSEPALSREPFRRLAATRLSVGIEFYRAGSYYFGVVTCTTADMGERLPSVSVDCIP
jgi:hypothetical protein